MSAGASATIVVRTLLTRAAMSRLRHDLQALNEGDYRPVLSHFAHDAVLRFNEGPHRWSGEHRGRPAIARFLRNFVGAGLVGQVDELFLAGPPWRLTLIARVNDHALDASGQELYRNHAILLVRTRWGRIVWHEDFFEDTQRIVALEDRLSERGVAAVE